MVHSEFEFELHACRWAELAWPPDGNRDGPVVVARQLGTGHRRWDTIVLECDPSGFEARRRFGVAHLDSDLLHVVRHAPDEWAWYRDALPEPDYPWRYVREAVHEAGDRGVIETRRRDNRIELRRKWTYPAWVDRLIAIEHKPDLDASAARSLAAQLQYDVALGLADEVWLATEATDDPVPPALLEAMPVEVGILALDPEGLSAEVVWHPRGLEVDSTGTRIVERPGRDRSAARIEFVSPEEKRARRREIAERAYERGWRTFGDHMRTDCRHFQLAPESLTHEPYCAAKDRPQRAAECHGDCPAFEPEPPGWRTEGWPIAGGPGRGIRELLDRQRARRR